VPREKKTVVGRDLTRRFLSAHDARHGLHTFGPAPDDLNPCLPIEVFKKATADVGFELEASSLGLIGGRGINPMLGRLDTQSAPPAEIDPLCEPEKVCLAVGGGAPESSRE
jgi:hypothetical protein